MASLRRRFSGTRLSRRAGLLRKSVGALVAGAALTTLGGCTLTTGLIESFDYCEAVDEAIISYRNQAMAARAWYKVRPRYAKHPQLDHFAAGWQQGYIDVANGGNGCTPAFPPREYWGWKYQSPAGQAAVGAWFSGYPLGAKAAEEDCVGHFTQIQTSYGIQNEYMQHGLLQTAEPAIEPAYDGGFQPEELPLPSATAPDFSAPAPPVTTQKTFEPTIDQVNHLEPIRSPVKVAAPSARSVLQTDEPIPTRPAGLID